MLALALDALAAAIFIVEADARIVHANAGGHQMLSDGGLLRSNAGRLSALGRHADYALQDALAAVVRRGMAANVNTIAIPLTTVEGELFIAHVRPLAARSELADGTAHSPVAAVLVRRAALDLPHSLATIGDMYGLTRAEMRVVTAIVEVGGVSEVARALGVAGTTVRTHLQRAYEKIGIKRRADLAKFVAGLVSPFARYG